jgi:hypothetical protein
MRALAALAPATSEDQPANPYCSFAYCHVFLSRVVLALLFHTFGVRGPCGWLRCRRTGGQVRASPSYHHRSAVGLGFFLAPGLIALSYALGELAHGYGFLSVFACAVTLRWLEMKSATPGKMPELPLIAVSSHARFEAAVNPSTAPLFLVELLLHLTDQLE